MAKRGRPPKEKKVESTTPASTPSTTSATGEPSEQMSEDTTLDLSGNDRGALYNRYTKEQTEIEGDLVDNTGTSPEQEGTEETTEKTPSDETTLSEESTETSTAKEVTTEEEVTEDSVTEQSVEGKEEKTVPLSALHEEREKRKSLSSKVAQLETQLKDILQDYKQRFESTQQPESEEEPTETEQLRKEINDLKQWKTDRDEKSRRDDATAKITHTNRQVINTDIKLEKEGYPGFQFAVNAVTAELQKLVAEDPENKYLDQPSGWEKVYKEKIFPTLKAKFNKQDKTELFDKKKELKSQAKLTTGGIKPEATEKKEESWTFDDYLQMRYEKQL